MESQPELTDSYLDKLIGQLQPNNPYPFLEHLDYFKTNGQITTSSIGDHWAELSGESCIITYIKGKITTSGANYANSSYQDGSCPWKKSFQSDEMMSFLKHPCDTGVVNQDGSINLDVLKLVIKACFEWNDSFRGFIMRKSTMKAYVEGCVIRDQDKPAKNHWTMPAYETVARNEWLDFFRNFADDEIDDNPIVTLDTFLSFYFQPLVLYNRVLANKLLETM
jgi:hypothetical protein